MLICEVFLEPIRHPEEDSTMKREAAKRTAAAAPLWALPVLCCATAMAAVDPIPPGWTLIEDDDPGWTIVGGASYRSTDEIPQLKKRLPGGNNTHIGIWEFVGASAAIEFEGTGVRVYGYQPGEGGRADVYIDNKLEQAGVVWDPKAAFEPDHLFFEKTGLPKGTHTLTVKSVAPGFKTLGQDNASVPTIDYILVQGRGTPTPEKPLADPRRRRPELPRLVPGAQPAGAEDIAFPPCGAVVDVTRPPYNAKGDGKTDDTDALQRALRDTMGQHKIIYLPNGTYLVSKTIRWSKQDSRGEDAWGFNYIQGQSAAKTILRLKDGTVTDASEPKSIMWCGGFGSADWFHNYIQNVTFDVGRGNPGAIGLQFYSNNTGALRRVRIISQDGQGAVGLDLASDMNGPLLARNILVQGFAMGIRCGYTVNSQTFEHVSLIGQSQCALRNDGQNISVRSLHTEGTAPAVQTKGGLMVLLGANLVGQGAAKNVPAISAQGRFYARDLATSGYREAIVCRGDNPGAAGPNVAEFVSHRPTSPFPSPARSLGLPVEETPEVPWDDLRTWAVVEAPPGGGDAAPAIQKAVDSGATTVFIAAHEKIEIRSPITIRGKVRRIFGCGGEPDYGARSRPDFIVADGEAPVVAFEHFGNINGGVVIDTNRTVVFRSVTAPLTVKHGGKMFFEDFGSYHLRVQPGQHVWARQLNVENQGTHVANNGGVLWILGYKTERGGTLLDTRGGGWSELLGNFSYTTTAGNLAPMFVNVDSSVFAMFAEVCYNGNPFRTLVRETRGGRTKEVAGGQGGIAPYIGYRDH
jgi:hypothetical protein